MTFHANALPDFPWDTLTSARQRAALYPEGTLDLTIGSPVDPTPQIALDALTEAADAHGYPPALGTVELQTAIIDWMKRRRNISGKTAIMLSVGSKETVALLPSMLGLGAGDKIGFPLAAYPTYDVGARLSGAAPVAIDTDADPASWPSDLSMVWINSPGNPNGHVLSARQLREIVAWAREHSALVASDECYAALTWNGIDAPSLLDDDVCDGNTTGLFMLYSLSKQSNLAGYRAAFMAGDPMRIAEINEIRKHAGFMVPTPVQHAMARMLADDAHVAEQAKRYERRRHKLLDALATAGLCNDPDNIAGLYLWVCESVDGGREPATDWELVDAFSRLGIVVAPGSFYGPAGSHNVRISLTATDEVIAAAASRMRHFKEALC